MTNQLTIHGIGQFNLYQGLAIEVAAAIICGALIGADREARHKSAGLSTNILICLGAMLYTSISLINIENVTGGPADPNRVVAQIVSGIGFLGAGSIIQSRGSVVGLTTAASIWIVAALGATVGVGHVLEALVFGIIVFTVLRYSRYVNQLLPSYTQKKLYSLQILSIGEILSDLESTLEFDRFDIKNTSSRMLDQNKNLFISNVVLLESSKNMIRISRKCQRMVQINKVSFVHFRGFDLEEGDEDFAEKIIGLTKNIKITQR
jgi:putative Mg2+ transporter-C (MgtC) family protein